MARHASIKQVAAPPAANQINLITSSQMLFEHCQIASWALHALPSTLFSCCRARWCPQVCVWYRACGVDAALLRLLFQIITHVVQSANQPVAFSAVDFDFEERASEVGHHRQVVCPCAARQQNITCEGCPCRTRRLVSIITYSSVPETRR